MSAFPLHRSRLLLRTAALVAVLTLVPTAAWAQLPQPGNYTGKGFDQCDAPSSAAMDAWRKHSDFQAVGIYISGDMRACQTQKNLTPAWVRHQIANGWHLIPITVGRQASCGRYADRGARGVINTRARNTYRQARKQGRIEARNAVAAAKALGIGPGSTLFNDMESWPTNKSVRCNMSVMWFLSGWSNQLHALDYLSGVYSSASTGIAELDKMRQQPPATYVLPDYIWIGEWNGKKGTDSAYIDADGWADQQRIHQYRGGHNEKHGGVTINIDSDWLDVRVREVPPPVPNADRRTPTTDGPPVCRAQDWADSSRIGGADRYDTAARIARARADGKKVPAVVLASGESYADALSAGFLTQRLGGRTGVLLTRGGELPAVTADALERLDPSTVYLIGGDKAIGRGVESRVRSLLGAEGEVVRIGGSNRYDTNLLVNAQARAASDAAAGTVTVDRGRGALRTALLASGQDFPDALAAAPATHGNGSGALPLLLNRGRHLVPQVRDQLTALDIEQVVVVGGTKSVPATAADDLAALGIAVTRIGGADRYETATLLADFEVAPASPRSGVAGGLGFDGGGCGTQTAYLASGQGFADALAGGPLAGDGSPSPMLLTRTAALSDPTATWLDDHDRRYGLVTALGGRASVSKQALAAARRAIG